MMMIMIQSHFYQYLGYLAIKTPGLGYLELVLALLVSKCLSSTSAVLGRLRLRTAGTTARVVRVLHSLPR